jgi:hypothetical protein
MQKSYFKGLNIFFIANTFHLAVDVPPKAKELSHHDGRGERLRVGGRSCQGGYFAPCGSLVRRQRSFHSTGLGIIIIIWFQPDLPGLHEHGDISGAPQRSAGQEQHQPEGNTIF